MALLHRPPLLIADEPTSALDLITQRDVLNLLVSLTNENNINMLFISHDLAALDGICDRMAILHGGVVVECGTIEAVLGRPQHPYTRQLVASVPRLHR